MFASQILADNTTLEQENKQIRDQKVANSTNWSAGRDSAQEQTLKVQAKNDDLITETTARKELHETQEKDIKRMKLEIKQAKEKQQQIQTKIDEIEEEMQ